MHFHCKASFHQTVIDRNVINICFMKHNLSSLHVIPSSMKPLQELLRESKDKLMSFMISKSSSESNIWGQRSARSPDSMNLSTLRILNWWKGNWFNCYSWNITWMNIFCHSMIVSKTSWFAIVLVSGHTMYCTYGHSVLYKNLAFTLPIHIFTYTHHWQKSNSKSSVA